MTTLLEQAFAEAKKLPAEEQDAFAKRMLADLADESEWDDAFANSQDGLARLAEEALAEHAAGKTLPLDSDKL